MLFFLLFLAPLGFLLFQVFMKLKIRPETGASKKRIDGKVVVVTGDYSRRGLPYETVKELASRGGKVILASSMHPNHARAAIGAFKESVGRNAQVEEKHLRLSSMESVREFCKEILAEESRLDILIHNPGPPPERRAPRYVTEEGLEVTVAENYLGQFLATHLLLGLMSRTPGSRIINVSSGSHHFVRALDVDNLNSDKSWAPSAVYAKCKLAKILFTRELHRRLHAAGEHVTVNVVHPGCEKGSLCETGLSRRERMRRFGKAVQDLLFQNVEESAETTVHVALAEEVEGVSGVYWADCQPAAVSSLAQDMNLGKRLWNRSARMVGLQPGESILVDDEWRSGTSGSGEEN